MRKAPAAVADRLTFKLGLHLLAAAEPTEQPKEFTDSYDTYIRKTMERLPDIPGDGCRCDQGRQADIRPMHTVMADKEAGIKADRTRCSTSRPRPKLITALAAAMLDRKGRSNSRIR